MVWYCGIQPLGELIDVGLDEAARAQCAFNVLATKRPSTTFVEELITLLEAAGVGTEGVNLFGTSKKVIPAGPGPFLSIRPTAGAAPQGTHNDGAAAYRRPSAQVLVRASTWAAAAAMANAAYDVLVAVRNQAVSA